MLYDTHCRCSPRKNEFCAAKTLGKVTQITPLKTQCTLNVLNTLRFLCKEHPLILTVFSKPIWVQDVDWEHHISLSLSCDKEQSLVDKHRLLWAHSLTFLNLYLLFHKRKIKFYLHHKTALNSKRNKSVRNLGQ